MVSLREGNPNQLLVYSMEVNVYIGFWTLKPKCTQYGLYGRSVTLDAVFRDGSELSSKEVTGGGGLRGKPGVQPGAPVPPYPSLHGI
jgi:hypothetical protein